MHLIARWQHTRMHGRALPTRCLPPLRARAQVRQYESVLRAVAPVFKPLLKPHLQDMERKVAPGLFSLTWASMNVDGYLHRFKQVRRGSNPNPAPRACLHSPHSLAAAGVGALRARHVTTTCCIPLLLRFAMHANPAGPDAAGGAGAQAE